jgi:hypothetical protein
MRRQVLSFPVAKKILCYTQDQHFASFPRIRIPEYGRDARSRHFHRIHREARGRYTVKGSKSSAPWNPNADRRRLTARMPELLQRILVSHRCGDNNRSRRRADVDGREMSEEQVDGRY